MAKKVSGSIITIGLWLALLGGPALAQNANASPDARAAYAIAAPGIKQIFPDAGVFLSMVRERYAPVYHHRSVEFGEAKVGADEIEQTATFVDDDGQVWKALYKLARQPDGQWLITGCALIKSDDKAA